MIIGLVADRETLVAALRERGVDWLAPSDAQLNQAVDDECLIASLAAHADPRLRQALIGLFLLHPDLADRVPAVQRQLSDTAATELTAFYMAAVYLQQMWRIRLGYYVPVVNELPDYFSSPLQLPLPEDEFGKSGLYELAEWHAERSPHRYNHRSAYEGVADLLFQSLKLRRVSHEPAPAG